MRPKGKITIRNSERRPIRPNSPARASTLSVVPLIVTSLFVLMVVTGTLVGRLPRAIIVTYGIVSILTFLLYWHDKSAARHGRWRTKERSLLFLGLVGGWPGAVVAQRMLHHKTRKERFKLAFWGTAVMNSIALGLLFTSSGSNLARQLLQ